MKNIVAKKNIHFSTEVRHQYTWSTREARNMTIVRKAMTSTEGLDRQLDPVRGTVYLSPIQPFAHPCFWI